MKFLISVFLIFFSFCVFLKPVQAQVRNSKICKISAWTNSAGPIEVRSSPDETMSNVVGYLPPNYDNGDYNFGVDVDVIGSQNGWFKINNATDNVSYTGLPKPRKTYNGKGWIDGKYLGFSVQSGKGYMAADSTSPLSVDLRGEWLTEIGEITKLKECSGEWVLLEAKITTPSTTRSSPVIKAPARTGKDGIFKAWFRRICPIRETTCDGLTD